MIGLILALTLIVGGILVMVAWEHPLSDVLANPRLIFWDENSSFHGGRLWLMGPLLIAAGAFWIAEDWFNFGQD
jgi:hypothetical protein